MMSGLQGRYLSPCKSHCSPHLSPRKTRSIPGPGRALALALRANPQLPAPRTQPSSTVTRAEAKPRCEGTRTGRGPGSREKKKPSSLALALGAGSGQLAHVLTQAAFPGQQSSWSPFGVGLERGGGGCRHGPGSKMRSLSRASLVMGEKKPHLPPRGEPGKHLLVAPGPGPPGPVGVGGVQRGGRGSQLEPSQGPAALTCLSHVLSGCAGDGDAGRTSMDAVGEFRLGEEREGGGREEGSVSRSGGCTAGAGGTTPLPAWQGLPGASPNPPPAYVGASASCEGK